MNKRIIAWIILPVILLVSAVMPQPAYAATERLYTSDEGTTWCITGNGHAEDDQFRIKCNDGKYYDYVGGWKQFNNKWYYFEENGGVAPIGYFRVNGKEYYANEKGEMQVGWILDDYIGYMYAKSNGELVRGWQRINGRWYYFEPDITHWYPNMYTGEHEIGGTIYQFGTGGALPIGWVKNDDRWYYYYSNGVAAKGWQRINGVRYYFFDNGVMAGAGYQLVAINGKNYIFEKSGALVSKAGWVQLDYGYWTHWAYAKADGTPDPGWKQSGSTWYYIDSDGWMADTPRVIGGYINDFDESGAWKGRVTTDGYNDEWDYCIQNGKALTGWNQIEGKWYYFDPEYGYMYKSYEGRAASYQCGSAIYLFDEDGVMLEGTGWIQDNGDWYYMNSGGSVKTGWQQMGGKWYYFYPYSGWNVRGTVQEIDGKLYYFDDQGVMQTGWIEYNDSGDYLYAADGGALAVGWKQVSGRWYYFDSNGLMYRNRMELINGATYFFGEGGAMMANTWINYNFDKYYLGAGGACVTGERTINGVKYLFSSDPFYPYLITQADRYRQNGIEYVLEDGKIKSQKKY